MRKFLSAIAIVTASLAVLGSFSYENLSSIVSATVSDGSTAKVGPVVAKAADGSKPGFPHVNFEEPRFAAAAESALSGVKAAASADLDSDGVTDIVAVTASGAIHMVRGTADTIYPNSPEAKQKRLAGVAADSPFTETIAEVMLGFAPDFVETGDVNADGHADVVIASRNSDRFFVLAGDGRGNLGLPQPFEVGGRITSITIGEIGRPDGQADLAVAAVTKEGPRLMVYEHPEGAFARKPEIHQLPAEATSLAIGRLDGDSYYDVAAACGNVLAIHHGRGQPYPLDMSAGVRRPDAVTQSIRLNSNIRAISVGRFTEGRNDSIAILDGTGNIELLEPRPRAPKTRPDGAALPDNARGTNFVPAGDQLESNERVRDVAVLKSTLPQTAEQAEEMGLLMGDRGRYGNDIQKLAEERMAERNAHLGSLSESEKDAYVTAETQKTKERERLRKELFEKNLAAQPVPFREFVRTTLVTDARLAIASFAGSGAKLVKAAVSDSGFDDLIFADAASGQLHIVAKTGARENASRANVFTIESGNSPSAVLPMRLNPDGLKDLLVLSENGNAQVLMTAPANVYVVDSNSSGGGDCNTPGLCTLRRAVFLANVDLGPSVIAFNIGGGGHQTINFVIDLEDIYGTVTIDGTTQPGFTGSPIIEIRGDAGPGTKNGLSMKTTNSVVRGLVINSMPATNGGNGQLIEGNGIAIFTTNSFPNVHSNLVEGNFLGTDVTGSVEQPNEATGVLIYDSDLNTVGGNLPASRNLISGNGLAGSIPGSLSGAGLAITAGNESEVKGNFIGTDITGLQRLGNDQGVLLMGINNVVGGDEPGSYNVISANGFDVPVLNRCLGVGVGIETLIELEFGQLIVDNNRIKGNLIGTNLAGNGPLGNCGTGVSSAGNLNTFIGSITAEGRNTISDNGENAVHCAFNFSYGTPQSGSCIVAGNEIGTDITGNIAIPNDQRNGCSGFCIVTDTVWMGTSSIDFSVVGSPGGTSDWEACTGFCNLVSGNRTQNLGGGGVYKSGFGPALIFNNYIGTNKAGTAALPNFFGFNSFFGSFLFGGSFPDGNGGFISGGNLVSGNYVGGGFHQPQEVGGTFRFTGNRFGTSSDGLSAISNGVGGTQSANINVFVALGTFVEIGGGQPGERNIISAATSDTFNQGTRGDGVFIRNFGGTVNIFGNFIGLNRDGDALGNSGSGVVVTGPGKTNVGGVVGGNPNAIAHNGRAGVFVYDIGIPNAPVGDVSIRGNSIRDNGGLGIDLADTATLPDGVTPNDCGDLDTGGNGLQNFPELDEPTFNGDGTVTVTGTISAQPVSTYLIDFYQNVFADPTNYGEGQGLIGSVVVTTDGNGFAEINFTSPGIVPPGQKISSTATDENGRTSEFSCIAGECNQRELIEARKEGGQCLTSIVVNSTGDEPDENTADGVCDIDTSNTGLQCTLRAAIEQANASPGFDIILFDIPGTGVHTISPLTLLPTISEKASILGRSQPGYSGTPLIEIRGDAGSLGTGIRVGASEVKINGLTVNRFSNSMIQLGGGTDQYRELTVENSYICINSDGETSPGAIAGSGILVGGRVQGASINGNTIGGCSNGVQLGSAASTSIQNVVVANNNIGISRSGSVTIPNDEGILLTTGSSNNVIGGRFGDGGNNISGNLQYGIDIRSNGNRILGNLIGLLPDGSTNARNQIAGIRLFSGSSNQIGGSFEERNVISGHRSTDSSGSAGIAIAPGASGNTIINNLIGTDINGSSGSPSRANEFGIWLLGGASNTIGGLPNQRNVISNNEIGVAVSPPSGQSVSNTTISFNRIGTDISGNSTMPNVTGILVEEGSDISNLNVSQNLISGNLDGVHIRGVQYGITIDGNRIGTNESGQSALPNVRGILMQSASGHEILSNLISGNSGIGIELNDLGNGPSDSNTIAGNSIGTNALGTAAVPNGVSGIAILGGSSSNTIGGTLSGNNGTNVGNTISGNTSGPGLTISEGSSGNLVQGNRIGIQRTAPLVLPNASGIVVENSSNNIIGIDPSNCTGPLCFDYANIIGGNFNDAIRISSGFSNTVVGNFVGVMPNGTPIANGGSGVSLNFGSGSNIIGGVSEEEPGRNLGSAPVSFGNTIAHNGQNGIVLQPTAGTGNRIERNNIFSNTLLGIDIGPAGLTPNDPGDPDEGPNRLQNFPEISNYNIDGSGDLIVTYRVDSNPAFSSYGADGLYIEFFKSDMTGEGKSFLGSARYTVADFGGGFKQLNLGNAAAIEFAFGDYITATATDAGNNTSEFFPVNFTPTSAGVSVSGRVLTADGRPVQQVTIEIADTDGNVRRVLTNSFGYYVIENVAAGRNYVLSAKSRQWRFSPADRILSVTDPINDADFTAIE
ncbi:MAG: CSLREA domain-containing protein [Acidobacteriota bacterium]|nr:MAG: CSLREA domain-containing protein [Acidobacteriota bacterium]